MVSTRDEKQCIICKFVDNKETRGRVSVHHICPWRICEEKRFEPKNGCVLCYKHHRQIGENELLWMDLLEELVKKSEAEYMKIYNKNPYETEN